MKRLGIWSFLVACCFGVFCCAVAPVLAETDQSPPLELRDIRIGLSGSFQVGNWTPASVKVVSNRNLSIRLVVLAPDADGQSVRSAGPTQNLIAGQEHVLTTRFCSGRRAGEITLKIEEVEPETSVTVLERKIRPGTGPTAEMHHELLRGFRLDVPFWGLCGLPETAIEHFKSTRQLTSPTTSSEGSREDQAPVSLQLAIEDLPENASDLAALDLLVLAAGAPSGNQVSGASGDRAGTPLFARLTDQQTVALRDWVEVRGGHLIVALGSGVNEFQSSKLGQWLALPLGREEEVRQLSGLEAFSGHPQPLKIDQPISVAQLPQKISGQILAQSLGVPLLIQRPIGFGRVSFLAVDLHRPPLSVWAGVELMLQRLQRGDRSDASRVIQVQSSQLAKSGINDLSSQLYAAEENFPSVHRVSIWAVMLLMGIYILLVGPFDYLIVHRWLKRPHLTWITFPLWIVSGVFFAVWLANSLNGTKLLTRQLDMIDLDAASGVLRGRSWFTVYSPKTSRRSIELDSSPMDQFRDPKSKPFEPAVNWLALPENRVGGLYREDGVQLTHRAYRRTEDGTGVLDYPLQVWSTGRFGGEWSSHAKTLVESKLSSSGFGQLTGTLMHRFPVVLEDCLLAFGNRVYFPVIPVKREKTAHLPQFYTWEIGRGGQPFEQRELHGYLTETYTKQIMKQGSKTGPEVLDVSKPYDPSRRDFPYIMRAISFHQSAGGRDYTQLRNDVLENLDLSQQLRMGRAVLVGRLKQSTAQWRVDGEEVQDPEPLTYVRIVLPVEKESTSGYRQLEKPNEGMSGAPRQ